MSYLSKTPSKKRAKKAAADTSSESAILVQEARSVRADQARNPGAVAEKRSMFGRRSGTK